MNTHHTLQTIRKQRRFIAVVIALMGVFALLSGGATARQFATIERVNVSTGGGQTANGQRPAISENGRFVAFWSDNGGLVPGDTNNTGDIFVHDRNTNETARVSIGNGNFQSNAITYSEFDISNNGTLIAMASDASNFVTGDTNGLTDVYVFDRSVGAMARISNAVQNQQTNGRSFNPLISGNGLYVLFRSDATNLIFNDTNGKSDIFLFDRTPGVQFPIAIVNVPTGPADASNQSNNEDPNSRFDFTDDASIIVFESLGSNLVAGDNNNTYDVFIRNRTNNTTTLASKTSGGGVGNGGSTQPVISGDGRYVAFRSDASNLVANDTNGKADIFVYDRVANTTKRVSLSSEGDQANNQSATPSISKNGRYIAFWSTASNLVEGDTNGVADIFVHDQVTGTTTRASVTKNGGQANSASGPLPKISADGTHIAFESGASNLVANDTNNSTDVFVGFAAPNAPTNLVATPLSETSIKIDWQDNSDDENKFIIERKTGSGDWGNIGNVGANIETYTDTGLTTCTEYSYRVSAKADIGRTRSAPITTKTLGCPPGDFTLRNPRNGETIINVSNIADFRWSASLEAETFNLLITRTSDDAVILESNGIVAGDYCTTTVCNFPVDTNLFSNGTYEWNATAFNAKGSTPAESPAIFTIDDTLPPRDFALFTPAADAYILTPSDLDTFTWRENRDAESYALVVYKVSNNPQSRLGAIINEASLTPAVDGDNLTCDSETRICSYAVSAGQQDTLTTGMFTWTVIASSPGGAETESSDGARLFSINTNPIELVLNGGFEDGKVPNSPTPTSWVLKRPTADKVMCNKDRDGDGVDDKVFANTGKCAFRFRGNVDELVNLQQNITDVAFITPSESLDFSLYANSTGAATLRVKIRVRYVDDGLSTGKANLTIPAEAFEYTEFSVADIPVDGAIERVKLTIQHRGTSGKIYIDDVSLTVDSNVAPLTGIQPVDSTGSIIPLPEAPDGFRR